MGIKPCRKRESSQSGSLEGATSPGTRMEETLPKTPEGDTITNWSPQCDARGRSVSQRRRVEETHLGHRSGGSL